MGKNEVKKKKSEPEEEVEVYDNRVYKIIMNFFKGSKPKIKVRQYGVPNNPPPYVPPKP